MSQNQLKVNHSYKPINKYNKDMDRLDKSSIISLVPSATLNAQGVKIPWLDDISHLNSFNNQKRGFQVHENTLSPSDSRYQFIQLTKLEEKKEKSEIPIKQENSKKSHESEENSQCSQENSDRVEEDEVEENETTNFNENFRKLEKRDKLYDSKTEDSGSDTEKNTLYIITPDNFLKKAWDVFIGVLLLYSAVVTPYRIAFTEDENSFYDYFDFFIDFVFALDILINFFSAYIDEEENIITKRSKIVAHYLSSWFVIDLISVIPINLLTNPGDPFSTNQQGRVSNTVGKIARIPKLYRLIKLTKLVRILKIAKKGNVNRMTRYFLEKLKVSNNIENLVYFVLGFLILNHLSACLWYLVAKLEDFTPDSWVVRLGFTDYDMMDLYIIAFYWNLTTVTTVGYGDITAGTTVERIYNLFIMSFGVVMYSFAIGSLTSIVSTLDAKTADFNQKMQTLYSIKHEFKLDDAVFEKVRKVVKYDLSRNHRDKADFLKELPNKLRIKLAEKIHGNTIRKMYFFRKQIPGFVASVAPLLKPLKYSLQDYIHKVGDTIEGSKYLIYYLVYFISKGTIVLSLSEKIGGKELKEIKKSKNFAYFILDNNFGEIEMCFVEKLSHNIGVKSKNVELFILQKNDFLKISVAFNDIINKFLVRSLNLYMAFNDEKKKAIKEWEEKQLRHQSMKEPELEGIQEEDDEENKSEKGGSDEEEEESRDEKTDKNKIIPEKENETLALDKFINEEKNFQPKTEKKSSKKLHYLLDKSQNNTDQIFRNKSPAIQPSNHTSSTFVFDFNQQNENNVQQSQHTEEIKEHIEKVKFELYLKFSRTVNRIIDFFESYNIKFDIEKLKGEKSNPLELLKQLADIKDINERNEIIENLEDIIRKYY